MQSSPNLLRVTLQSIRDAVVTTDQAACVQMLNRTAEALTGWSSAEAAAKPIEQVVDLRENRLRRSGPGEDVIPRFNPVHAAMRDGLRVDIEESLLLVAKDGRRTQVQITASPLRDPAGQVEGCVLVLHDLSEAMQLAERFSYQAHHDPLTGLPNRILLVDRLEQATKAADRHNDQVAVIFVDLDHFSRIKASFGNGPAEEMLKESAFRILATLRESDTVSRLGTDEFVIMVTGVNSVADVEAVSAKLLEEIAKPHFVGEHTLQTSCSIGISIYPRDATDAGTLMRLADGAMHQAKREGRNRYLFAKLGAAIAEPTL